MACDQFISVDPALLQDTLVQALAETEEGALDAEVQGSGSDETRGRVEGDRPGVAGLGEPGEDESEDVGGRLMGEIEAEGQQRNRLRTGDPAAA